MEALGGSDVASSPLAPADGSPSPPLERLAAGAATGGGRGSARPVTLSPAARSRAKRVLDLAVALLAAPVVLPLALTCAALVKVTSRGPAVFRQERVGLGGQTFSMYKFRTMRADAEERLHSDPDLWDRYVANDYKLPAELDARITPVGRFLRRSSLDELPQILNVLGGTMSLVGPRPVVPSEVAKYGDHAATYLSVRPGLTGAWQVNGRSTVDYPDRVALDAESVRTWSLWQDVKILARTPLAVISARGAY